MWRAGAVLDFLHPSCPCLSEMSHPTADDKHTSKGKNDRTNNISVIQGMFASVISVGSVNIQP